MMNAVGMERISVTVSSTGYIKTGRHNGPNLQPVGRSVMDIEVPWWVDLNTRLAQQRLNLVDYIRVVEGARPEWEFRGYELPSFSSFVVFAIVLCVFVPFCSTWYMKFAVLLLGIVLAFCLKRDALTKVESLGRWLKIIAKIAIRTMILYAVYHYLNKGDLTAALASAGAGAHVR